MVPNWLVAFFDNARTRAARDTQSNDFLKSASLVSRAGCAALGVLRQSLHGAVQAVGARERGGG